jgi:hypothetical protein
MFKIFVSPAGILTKMFHPSIGNTIDKNERAFDHFKTELAAIINAVPGPTTISKDTQVPGKSQDTIDKEDTTLD